MLGYKLAVLIEQRFLEIASFSQGQVLNMSAIARKTNIYQKNVSNYFDILDGGYQLFYWRTTAGVEVGFIVDYPKGFFAFEMKRSNPG